MQRSPQGNTQNTQGQRDAQPHMSPAYIMAARIRNEQGRERAGEYLAAMEPFLAPGERAHIAAQLGVPLMQPPAAPPPGAAPAQQQFQQQFQQFQQQMPNMFSQFSQQRGGMNDPAQLMQMLNAISSMNGGGKNKAFDMNGMNSTMMLAQLLGGMMNNKK